MMFPGDGCISFRRPGLTLLVAFVLFLQQSCKTAVESCIYDPVNSNVRNFPVLRNHKVTGINVAGGMFTGLLEFTPPEYNRGDTSRLYPLIIYFHGREARGTGNATDLCKILWDGITGTGSSLPPLIEGNGFPEVVKSAGKLYSFIVLSPQFRAYDYPKDFPSVNEVDAFIDYAVTNYRVDRSRVYLTGMSTGANMVIEYAASKKSFGKIAAISTASLCDSMTIRTNLDNDINAANLASNGHGVWLMHCVQDERCSFSISKEWYTNFRKLGGQGSRFTMFDDSSADPEMRCARYEHNTWYRMYDTNFRVEGSNLYEWFLKFTCKPGAPTVYAP
ncbi:MAG TPA: hypothetical protein VLC28_01345 [Flavitalea sp.]|nr:hypothetical protein [Flavitalea sp.]